MDGNGLHLEQTPLGRYLVELERAEALGENEPIDYFRAGQGSMWLLCLAQGLERLQAHCLAVDGALLRYR